MRLARYQQNPQPIPYAGYDQHCPIVLVGQFVRLGLGNEFNNIFTPMGQGQGDGCDLTRMDGQLAQKFSVMFDADRNWFGRPPFVFNAKSNGNGFIDDAEARGFFNNEFSVWRIWVTDQQGVKRRIDG